MCLRAPSLSLRGCSDCEHNTFPCCTGAAPMLWSRRVLANRPALLGKKPLPRLDGRGFEFGRHRVVKAVEETEERDHGNDVHNLDARIVLLQLGKIRVGDRVRHLGGPCATRSAARSASENSGLVS